ncbi:hypothetical protein V8G54_037379 [Vigna mungo]|uniref:Uncharacterized protein n=1 Tax=Vigna mungo TaxID=3915 RepID=A0AAQ3MJ49_VIGMU
MDNQMQKLHSCSSTCNWWRNQNPNVIFRGSGVSRIGGVSLLFLYGEKTIVRTTRTAKNRGKYKNGHEEDGCNFFKWCCGDGIEKSYTNLKWEEKHEYFQRQKK